MMSFGSIALIAAYIFVAALLLFVLRYSRWRWPVKVGATVLVAAFCAISWLSVPELLGWPVTRDPPQKFRLHAAHIQQPDKATKSKGTINLWLTDARDMANGGTPRAFALPYSPPLHETVLNAMNKMTKGVQQMGEFKAPGGARISGLDDPARAQGSVSLIFYDIPDPLFPDK